MMPGFSPAFQFYPNDWLSSKKVRRMTPEERGAYIHLLASCWETEECGLTKNIDDLIYDAGLELIDRTHAEQVLNTVQKLCFSDHPDHPDMITNMRLLDEKRKQETNRENKRLAGIKSGESRRKGNSKKNNEQKRTGVEQVLNRPRTEANSSISSSTKKKNSKRRSGNTPSTSFGEEGSKGDSLNEWQVREAKILAFLKEQSTPTRLGIIANHLGEPDSAVNMALGSMYREGKLVYENKKASLKSVDGGDA